MRVAFRDVLVGTLMLNTAVPASAQDTARLARRIDSIAHSVKAAVGVGIIHVETGREIYQNGDKQFPLASTYKVPIAVEILTRVDKGDWKLDSVVPLSEHDLVPFGSQLTDQFKPDQSFSIRRYMELMLTLSDNSATDVLLRLMGGTAPVRQRLQAMGVNGITVSRSVQELGAEWIGFPLPPWPERNLVSLSVHGKADGKVHGETPIRSVSLL